MILSIGIEMKRPEETEVNHGGDEVGADDERHGDDDFFVVACKPHGLEVLDDEDEAADH